MGKELALLGVRCMKREKSHFPSFQLQLRQLSSIWILIGEEKWWGISLWRLFWQANLTIMIILCAGLKVAYLSYLGPVNNEQMYTPSHLTWKGGLQYHSSYTPNRLSISVHLACWQKHLLARWAHPTTVGYYEISTWLNILKGILLLKVWLHKSTWNWAKKIKQRTN